MKIFSWVACAAFAAPLWGAIPAHPGMLNYMEGQASINGEPVNSRSVGSMDVERGQVLQTGQTGYKENHRREGRNTGRFSPAPS